MQSTLFSVIIKEKNNLNLIEMERRCLMIQSEKSCTWEYSYKKDVGKVLDFLENKSSDEIVGKLILNLDTQNLFLIKLCTETNTMVVRKRSRS